MSTKFVDKTYDYTKGKERLLLIKLESLDGKPISKSQFHRIVKAAVSQL